VCCRKIEWLSRPLRANVSVVQLSNTPYRAEKEPRSTERWRRNHALRHEIVRAGIIVERTAWSRSRQRRIDAVSVNHRAKVAASPLHSGRPALSSVHGDEGESAPLGRFGPGHPAPASTCQTRGDNAMLLLHSAILHAQSPVVVHGAVDQGAFWVACSARVGTGAFTCSGQTTCR
jgi:hypothetical protein